MKRSAITHLAFGLFAGSFLSGCASVEQFIPLTMSHANVVAVLDSIDQAEIDAGELAKQRGASQNVRSFGTRLVQEHRSSMQERHSLAEQIGVEPKKPQLALALEQEQEEARNQLGKTSGREFDQAFIKYQIMLHQQVLKLLQDTEYTLDQPELRQHLRYMGPDLLSHLSAARTADRQLAAHR